MLPGQLHHLCNEDNRAGLVFPGLLYVKATEGVSLYSAENTPWHHDNKGNRSEPSRNNEPSLTAWEDRWEGTTVLTLAGTHALGPCSWHIKSRQGPCDVFLLRTAFADVLTAFILTMATLPLTFSLTPWVGAVLSQSWEAAAFREANTQRKATDAAWGRTTVQARRSAERLQ